MWCVRRRVWYVRGGIDAWLVFGVGCESAAGAAGICWGLVVLSMR